MVLLPVLVVINIAVVCASDSYYTNYRDSKYADLQSYTPYPTPVAPGTTCCMIPVCSKYGCFKSKVCGYLCHQGPYTAADRGPTPGYNILKSYTELSCHFGVCSDFKVDCSNCPDPKHQEFRFYNVKQACAKCYVKEFN